MNFYLRQLNSTRYPKVAVSSIGKSVEGRDIYMVHIQPKGVQCTGSIIEETFGKDFTHEL